MCVLSYGIHMYIKLWECLCQYLECSFVSEVFIDLNSLDDFLPILILYCQTYWIKGVEPIRTAQPLFTILNIQEEMLNI